VNATNHSTPVAEIKWLIVDDHAAMRQMIRSLLGGGDHATRECGDGDTALRVAAEFRPDAVTLDVRMPGLGAFAVARALRAALPAVRLIVVTSYDQPDYRDAAREVGAAFVLKDDLSALPFVAAQLFA
jgi:two-component system response regulator DesR